MTPASLLKVVAFDEALLTLDGIEADSEGDIHGVIPGFAVLKFLLPEESFSPLVRINPEHGEVAFTVTDPKEAGKFKTPLSLSFGTGERREHDIQLREKKPMRRFRMEKLEERIAPSHPGLGPAFGRDGDPPFGKPPR